MKSHGGRHHILIAASLATVLGLAMVWLRYTPLDVSLQYNGYAVLSALTIVANSWLVVLMLKHRLDSEEAGWFVFYTLAVALAAIGEALQRLSVSPAAALYWANMSVLGIVLLPVAFYLFVVSYIKPLRAQTLVLMPVLLLGASVMGFFGLDLMYKHEISAITWQPWGYIAESGNGFYLILAWVELFFLASLYELTRQFRHTTNQLLRRQTRLYLIAILIPLILGTFTDGILPLLGYNSLLPPLAIVMATGTSLVTYYGLGRYRLFRISPALLAEKVLATMHEAVVITRGDFRIDLVNAETERLFGRERHELAGRHLRDFIPEGSWSQVAGGLSGNAVHRSNTGVGDLVVQSGPGRLTPVRITSSRLVDGGNLVAYIFVIADITDITVSYRHLEDSAHRIKHLLDESRQLQKQLADEKANIEHTVEVRTRQLRLAQAKLQEADKLKTEFIIIASHNLRTPLAIVRGITEILAESKLSAEQKTQIQQLNAGAARLGELIEELLTIATLEAGEQLLTQPVLLSDVLDPIVDQTRKLANSAHLKFEADIKAANVAIQANPTRLQGAIRVVLGNAIKFTKAGNVRLTAQHQHDTVLLRVKDTGIGIAPEELSKLFTKFHRGTSVEHYDYEGEGIGLYMAKLIIDEHGGRIWAESSLGAGSQFFIELPITDTVTTKADKATYA